MRLHFSVNLVFLMNLQYHVQVLKEFLGFSSACFYAHFEVSQNSKKLKLNKSFNSQKNFLPSLEVVFDLCEKELMCKLGDNNIRQISCNISNTELTCGNMAASNNNNNNINMCGLMRRPKSESNSCRPLSIIKLYVARANTCFVFGL